MLTSDLLKTRRRGGKVIPAYLRGKQRDEALPLADNLIRVFSSAVGMSSDELDESVREVSENETDRLRVAGFVKLLRDRCVFETSTGVDPMELRASVFEAASEARKQLGIRDAFDRGAVLDACAASKHLDRGRLEAMLFADLPGAQVLQSFRPISADGLLQRYDLALAQGVLLRATRVTIDLQPTTAPRVRQLLRAMKFHRLMFDVTGTPRDGYRIVLDGPMSLFESTQRYGVQLAMFLPVLVAGEGWKLGADLRWGKDRTDAKLELSEADGLVSHQRGDAAELEEVGALLETFGRLECAWKARRASKIFNVKGRTVFVPDLCFEHDSGRKVYLEAFGYWSRDAVFERVEVLESGMREKFILAVSKKLRVSAEIAGEDFPGVILVYTSAISAHAVRKVLDELL